jgi:hypothetical protein
MISKEVTSLEDHYETEIEEKVLDGQIHPRLVRWYQEDQQNDQPVDNENQLISRYLTCKTCENFNNILKVCKACNCFMPLKVQIKKSKCPEGKW